MKIQADEAKAVFEATTKRVGTESQWQYDEEMKARDHVQAQALAQMKASGTPARTEAPWVSRPLSPEEGPDYGTPV